MAVSRSFPPSMFGRDFWDAVDYPSRIFDQHFGTGLLESDLCRPVLNRGNTFRSRTLAEREFSGESEVKNEKDKFQAKLSVVHFKPEEIEVKVVGDCIVIHGKHEEKTDDHGLIQREFTRRYKLPEGAEMESVKSSLADGILTVEAPKKTVKVPERVIPIKLSADVKTEVSQDKMEVSEEKTSS